MSSAGQAIGGVVGAVVGFFTPIGPMYGAQIGMMIGGVLDPPRTEGPRLEDLTTQTSVYGAFIPRLYGTTAVTGNVIWIQGDKLIERSVESDGKGGPVVTNFEYFATFAVGLCEGPIDGVRRIWIGGQLWYDAQLSNTGSTGGSNFTLYPGTDTQLADPLIQADRGVANVPAYRGLAYIVFEMLPLKDYGNSLVGAQVKVEVVKAGALVRDNPRYLIDSTDGYRGSAPVYYAPTGTIVYNQTWRTLYFYDQITETQISTATTPGDVWSIQPGRAGTLWAWGQWDFYIYDVMTGAMVGIAPKSSGVSQTEGKWSETGGAYLLPDQAALLRYTEGAGGVWSYAAVYTSPHPGVIWQSMEVTNTGHVVLYSDYSKRVTVLDPFYSTVLDVGISDGGSFPFDHTSTYDPTREVVYICNSTNDFIITVDLSDPNQPTATEVAVTANTAGVHPLYHKQSDSLVIAGTGAWPSIYIRDPDDVSVLVDSFGGDPTYWGGVPYMNGWPFEIDSVDDRVVHFGSDLVSKICVLQFGKRLAPDLAALSTIVESECLQSGLLTASDLDVTELTDQVRGYRISSLAPLRGGIDQLRKAWPFDAIQHGYKIKFKKRGGASVATITEGELDAREAGANPGVRISNVREMDLILPQQLTVQYMDSAREYDVNVAEESR